jgi:YaiO family outer membrane protein
VHDRLTSTVTKTALILSAFGACLGGFTGTVLGSGAGLKSYTESSQNPGAGYAASLLKSQHNMNKTGLRPPSASSNYFGQGLRLPQAQDGALDSVVPIDQGFYYSGSRAGVRHGLHASETFFGVQTRHSTNWYSQLQTSITRAGGLVPLHSVSGHLQTTLSAGWELSLGLRYDMRDAVNPESLSYAADGYPVASSGFFPPWNAAHAPANGGINYRLQLNYRYGTRSNSFGLGYSSGRHPDELVARGLPLDDSRQFSLTGNHWLNQDWALNYGVVSGEMNRRQGLHLGLRYQF